MIAKIIKLFLLVVACSLFAASISAQQILSAKELIGDYTWGSGFVGETIRIEADGTFSQHYQSCTFMTLESGKYVFSDGLLRFKILKYTDDSKPDIDLFDPQNRKEFFGYRDNEKIEPIDSDFSLMPVKWGERLYLLKEYDFKNFANAVNLHLEPRFNSKSEFSSSYYFYLRDGDHRKRVIGKPLLPTEWQSFLLDKPVTAKIISLEEKNYLTTGIINKGSRSGLRVGMLLIGKGQTPFNMKEGEILSVEENTAKVRILISKKGDFLSSRYIPSEFDR